MPRGGSKQEHGHTEDSQGSPGGPGTQGEGAVQSRRPGLPREEGGRTGLTDLDLSDWKGGLSWVQKRGAGGRGWGGRGGQGGLMESSVLLSCQLS